MMIILYEILFDSAIIMDGWLFNSIDCSLVAFVCVMDCLFISRLIALLSIDNGYCIAIWG